MDLERTIELTAGKLLAENCDPETLTEREAIEKTMNCVGFHLLQGVIQNNLEEVKEEMRKGVKPALKTVKVIFENSKHNYYTSVNGECSDEGIKKYFIGTRFNVGIFPIEDLQECIAVEIKQKK